MHDISDPFAMLGVSSAILPSVPTSIKPVLSTNQAFEASKPIVPITPPNDKKTGTLGKQPRRYLELDLPSAGELQPGNLFRVMDDYLIYQTYDYQTLVLIDFWPVW